MTAIVAAHIFSTDRGNRWLRNGVTGLMVIFALESLASHPDYLAYTTPLIGSEPERFIAESDLDWGQDVKRLATRLRAMGVDKVTFTPYLFGGVADVPGMPATERSAAAAPARGWNAVSVSDWKVSRMGAGGPGVVPWPDGVSVKPVARIGKTILLWHFETAPGNAPAEPGNRP